MIPVTKPFLPPIEEITKHLRDIYESNYLTNEGPKLLELKEGIRSYLDINNLSLVTNGTLAIQLAIKSMNIKGEILTTPFSYIATTSSILWENCTPVFVDINQDDLTINPDLIEDKINDKTEAILATHVYGLPCHVDKIKKLSKKYNLKVIYDGAHAFGVKLNGKSIFRYGDASTCSTHATKLFHTVEGGFIASDNNELISQIDLMKNFGHTTPYTFSGIGINAKLSEVHSIFGIVNLSLFDKILNNRKRYFDLYDSLFEEINKYRIPTSSFEYSKNYSYYPLIFQSEERLMIFKNYLEKNGISIRRYFYPSLDFNFNSKRICKVSNDISRRILCLPVFSSYVEEDYNSIKLTIEKFLIEYN